MDCAIQKPHEQNHLKPTQQTYDAFQHAYDLFNSKLFGDRLPQCVITLQRKARTLGYFCGRRFENQNGDRTDEIALNPAYFASRSERGVLSTLAHEMVHLSQFHFGHFGRRGYHNRQWAEWMKQIGLYPSDTAQPGGKEIGYRVSHYIVEGGKFDCACTKLIDDGFAFEWVEAVRNFASTVPPTTKAVKGTDSSNRWRYTCPICGNNAWGKPEMPLICGVCKTAMPQS